MAIKEIPTKKKAKIVVGFAGENHTTYKEILKLSNKRMTPAAFMRTAVVHYIEQIENKKVIL